MSTHNRQNKSVLFSLDGENYECQLEDWTFDPGEPDGERVYTACPDGGYIDPGDPDPSLMLKLTSDWRETGVSTYLMEHRGEDVAFSLSHHADISAENIVLTGTLRVKAPPIVGTPRQTEKTEVTFKVLTWDYVRGGA